MTCVINFCLASQYSCYDNVTNMQSIGLDLVLTFNVTNADVHTGNILRLNGLTWAPDLTFIDSLFINIRESIKLFWA